MRNRLAVLACVFALSCVCIGCGATAAAPNSTTKPTSPTSPADPTTPTTPTDPSTPTTTTQLEITTTQLPAGTSNSPYSAQLAATGGTAPYAWSISGAMPSGLTMSSAGVLSGTPTAAGQSTITVEVKDSEPTPQTSQVPLALDVATGVSNSAASTPSTPQYYGPGINMISLNNFALDSAEEYVDYTFTAQQTGSIETMMPYFVDCKTETSNECTTGTGLYGGGNGAELQINVYPDNGSGEPDMGAKPLASITPFWVCGGGAITEACRTQANTFRKLSFEEPLSVVVGTEYHIVFRNIASDPSVNFSSVDESWSSSSLTCPSVTAAANPTFAPSQLGLLKSNNGGSTWGPSSDGTCDTPIVDLGYSNGFHQGNGYTMIGDFTAAIGGSNDIVREVFTVGGSNKTVSAVSVDVNLVSGTEGLWLALQNSSGTVLAKGQALPVTGRFSFWRTYKFSSPVTLQSGQTYRLVLTATGTYSAGALENGSQNGEPFSPDTVWSATNAEAQYSTNDGDTWNEWDDDGANEVADLMFYFTLE